MMQALLNGSFGLFVGTALWAVGVPSAALWAAVAAIMRFVPFVGSVLAAIPPLLLAAAVEPGWTMLVATLGVFAIGEPIMGHVIEPLMLGKRAGISPFAMVASASFWTVVWGPVGLILAAPLTMALVVLGRYIDGLEFFSVLLGDEPALLPEQEFYHRLLSDDSVAAVEAFESALENSTIGDVSDALVLPALRLAAHDHRRGRLDKVQIDHVTNTVEHLKQSVLALDDEQTAKAPADRSRVLVVAARGPIDAAAADFVGALLEEKALSRVTVVEKSSGLTALSSARSLLSGDVPHTIVVVTVGGLDSSQLQFIAKRAAKDFPGSDLIVLDFKMSGEGRGLVSDAGGNVAVLRRADDVLQRFGYSRRQLLGVDADDNGVPGAGRSTEPQLARAV